MKYQLVVKANYQDQARLRVSDIVGGEDIVSIQQLAKMPERYVALIDVDIKDDPYAIGAFEAALNWGMNRADTGLIWWSRVE